MQVYPAQPPMHPHGAADPSYRWWRKEGADLNTRKRYVDRADAGRALATALHNYAGADSGVVLALPRGGVPVAAPVADALHLPLDVVMVRKLGLPGHAQLAMGAIAAIGSDIHEVRNEQVLARSGVTDAEFTVVRRREEAELRRRAAALRGGRPPPSLTGLVVLVDDGLATGATMFAAIDAVRAAQRAVEPVAAARLVVAVPVGSGDTCRQLLNNVDDVVCLWLPLPFGAVSEVYRDFTQTSDEEVIALLDRADR